MRQKPDKKMWLNCYIVWVVHPAICSSGESKDIPIGNRAKQNNTEFREETLGRGFGFYGLRR